MVFSAYYDYKRWWAAYQEERREQGRQAGRAEGEKEARARIKRVLEMRGVTLPPEVEKALFGEPGGCSCGCPHCCATARGDV